MIDGISLIVATINRTDELVRFIQSLHPIKNLPVDLIIVDQNRDDRVDKLLHSLMLPEAIHVQHMKFDRNNQSMARNYGLNHARYELIAFPDDDCWYEFGTLSYLAEIFRSKPEVGVVIGQWIENPTPVPIESIPVTVQALINFRSMPTSAIIQFYRRNALPDEDPFDSRFGAYKEHGGYFGSGEETDLIMSVAKQGYSVLFSPTVRVHHLYTTRRFIRPQEQFTFTRHRARGTGGLYAKHQISLFVVARGIITPLLRSITSIFTPSKFVVQAGLSLGRVEGLFRWHRIYR